MTIITKNKTQQVFMKMWRNSKPYILMESESVSHSVRSDSVTGSSVHGILQERILEWVAIPFSEDLPDPGIKPGSPVLQADSLLSEPPGKAIQITVLHAKAGLRLLAKTSTHNLWSQSQR